MTPEAITIDGVTIGDRFIDTCHRKTKLVSTVIDFIERRSLVSGEVIGHEVVATHEFMGQTIKKTVLITTVLIGKLNEIK